MIRYGRVFRRMGLPAWTFFGIGIAAIWFNTLSELLEAGVTEVLKSLHWPTTITFWFAKVLVIVIPFLLVTGVAMWQQAKHRVASGRAQGADLKQPAGKLVLLLLVSNLESAMFAIRYHFATHKRLVQVHLIYSSDQQADKFGGSSRSIADQIAQEAQTLAQSEGRDLAVTVPDHGVSPADAQDTFDYVNRIYRNSGCEPGDIIADFTGGTKPMTTGMIMACLKSDRELEYVPFNPKTRSSSGPYLIDYQHTAFDLIG
jgi:hypothetical protein